MDIIIFLWQNVPLFRLDCPQPPPLEIVDNIQKPTSTIRNFANFLKHSPDISLSRPPQVGGKCECFDIIKMFGLLSLDPPQPPPIFLADTANKSRSRLRKIDSNIEDQTQFLFPQSCPIFENSPGCVKMPGLILEPPQQPPVELLDSVIKKPVLMKRKLPFPPIKDPVLSTLIPPHLEDSRIARYDKFFFRMDPPQQPPTEIADGCSNQVWRKKKLATMKDPLNLNILLLTIQQDREERFLFILDPPQPPPVEIIDNILKRGQKFKIINEILIEPQVNSALIRPTTEEFSYPHFDTSLRYLDPPQPPPIQVVDTPIPVISFRQKVLREESLEGLVSLLCAHPSAETMVTKTENINSSVSWLSPPQPPPIELEDDFSPLIFSEKQFNINKFVKSQITLTFLPPVTTKLQASQHQKRNETVEMIHFFRLEPPQPPPLDIRDNIQAPASKIKNIHELESVKSLALILQHPLGEETAKYEYHGGALLKLDPPQPPPLHLEDNIQKPVFKIRTFSRISNVPEVPTLQPPEIPVKVFSDNPCDSARDSFRDNPRDSPHDPPLFRLSPPQPPLIEIEDSANRIISVLKKCLDLEGIKTPEYVIPTQVPEPSNIHDYFPIPSTDLQRPEVDINDRANKLLRSECKALEENSNISSSCDVTVPIPIPPSPLITSCRKDLRRSPPSSPPTELADKPNSINFCKKNYYPEMISASFQFLQPQIYVDVLLRKVKFLKHLKK